jgi:hypothetical protein
MSYKRQKKNTQLPKVLRDELVSLGMPTSKQGADRAGKLDARKFTKRPSHGRKDKWIPPHLRKSQGSADSSVSGEDVAVPRANRKKPPRLVSAPSNDEEESSNSDSEAFCDAEDRAIAELEKKLGMGKRKTSKLGDDELDGTFLLHLY